MDMWLVKKMSYREFNEFGKFPKWYGIAWRPTNTLTYVLLPIPLNMIVNWCRSAYIRAYQYCGFESVWGTDESLPYAYKAKCRKEAEWLTDKRIKGLQVTIADYKERLAIRTDEKMALKKDIQSIRDSLNEVKNAYKP
jgi:hypothetical protein